MADKRMEESKQTVRATVKGAQTMNEARRRLLNRFTRLRPMELVGVANQGPGNLNVHIALYGNPELPRIDIFCFGVKNH